MEQSRSEHPLLKPTEESLTAVVLSGETAMSFVRDVIIDTELYRHNFTRKVGDKLEWCVRNVEYMFEYIREAEAVLPSLPDWVQSVLELEPYWKPAKAMVDEFVRCKEIMDGYLPRMTLCDKHKQENAYL